MSAETPAHSRGLELGVDVCSVSPEFFGQEDAFGGVLEASSALGEHGVELVECCLGGVETFGPSPLRFVAGVQSSCVGWAGIGDLVALLVERCDFGVVRNLMRR